MRESASCSQLSFEERVERCRTYWLEPVSGLSGRARHVADLLDLWDFCRLGRRPPPECMLDRLGHCKGRMLVELARDCLCPLTEIHLELLWGAAFGTSHPLKRARDDAKSLVDAHFLEWLLTNPMAARLVHHTGIHVSNITLSGDLNLHNATIGFPVDIVDSRFFGINLADAATRSINLEGSDCDYLNAARIKIDGRLRLAGSKHTSFRANGPVDLAGAQISGDLECSGGSFKASATRDAEPWALKLDLANISGSVLLADTTEKLRFDADGQIYALEMTVGGNFDCTNAKITNRAGERHAISLDRSKIGGCVFLRNGFSATGEVRLIGTQIAGDLDCSGGAFSNNEDDTHPRRVALEVRNAHITNCVYLGGILNKAEHFGKSNSSFYIDGLISFDGAYIGRDLFIGKHNDNSDGIGNDNDNGPRTMLNADRINIRDADVTGSLRCMADFSNVMLCLDDTNIEGLVMISSANLWPKELSLKRLHYNGVSFQDAHNAQDTKSSPAAVDLEGFSYHRRKDEGAHGSHAAMQRREKGIHFANLLGRDKIYSPQQYEYLGRLLANAGSPREANTVLYAGCERARIEAREQENWPTWILLCLQKYTIGYGIGMKYFRALGLALVLALVGIAVLLSVETNVETAWNVNYLLYASLDNILPIMKFNYNQATRESIESLNNWQLHVFNLLKLLGYILTIFIAAGVAGLTQKR